VKRVFSIQAKRGKPHGFLFRRALFLSVPDSFDRRHRLKGQTQNIASLQPITTVRQNLHTSTLQRPDAKYCVSTANHDCPAKPAHLNFAKGQTQNIASLQPITTVRQNLHTSTLQRPDAKYCVSTANHDHLRNPLKGELRN